MPGSAIPSVGIYGLSNIDKLVHFILFGVIAITWMTYTSARSPLRWRQWIIIFCLFSIVLGIVLEFVQLYYIPNRDFDTWDIVADTAGAVVFSILFFNAERRKQVK